jgi:diguanylate cyclase (GGDEF)-like protein
MLADEQPPKSRGRRRHSGIDFRPRRPRTAQELEEVVDQLRSENLALRRENSMFRTLVYRDDLTGLYNRRHFHERLAQEWSRAHRSGVPLSLVVIDINDFKHINDSYGHAAGDSVLAWVGDKLAHGCRNFDVACRIGGDEFAIVLPDTDVDGARTVVERIESTIEGAEDAPGLPGGSAIRLSFGVATSSGLRSPIELLRSADEAMYADKRARKAA